MNDVQIIIGDYRLKVENPALAPLRRVNIMKRWFKEYPSYRSYRAGKCLALELRQSEDPVTKKTGEDLRLFIAKRSKLNPRKKKLKEIPPPDATMKVPASDGKMHWSDGVNDLGACE